MIQDTVIPMPAGHVDVPVAILPQHMRLITDSGISPEVASEREYRSVKTRAELERLGFAMKQCRVPALLIPIRGVTGEIVLYQARPDGPRINTRGKPIKYETPGKSRMALDVPPRVRSALGNPKRPLFITEGVRKADAAASKGLNCIALLGVWNWRGTNDVGGKVALADWDSIALNGRDVYIAFDSDVTTKPEVQQALTRLRGFLESRKACVRIVYLPSGEGGTKVGLDDFLAAGHDVDDLIRLSREERFAIEGERKPAHEYEATDRGLVWNRWTSNGPVPVLLTNFTARIVADIARDDGVETTRAFEIEARLGKRVSRFSVPAARFASMNWPTEHMGAEAVIFPGQSQRDHARAAVQLLSGPVDQRTMYAHTGWRVIDGAPVYLHAGGAIGRNGQVAGVQVDLPSALAEVKLPDPPTDETLRSAVAASLDLLRLAPDRISVPVLAATCRSVLGGADSSIHLSGPTGAGKTELAARCMQHFGPGFSRTALPGSWSSTGNSLEVLAFIAKDLLLPVDDFCPTGSSSDVHRIHREADRLFRGQGNNSGRGRLSSDGTLRNARPPRGLILSTGEDIPRGQSLRARMLVVAVGPYDIDFDLLTEAQKVGQEGVYAAAMAGYLKWLAPRYEGLKRKMPDEVHAIRAAAVREGQHRPAPSIVADLYIGFRTFVSFAQDVGAIESAVGDELLKRAWAALLDVAREQAEHQATSEPTARFFELLRSALASGEAYVATFEGTAPEDAGAWGWRERIVGMGTNERKDLQPLGHRVGWIDETDIYLDRDAAYRACEVAAGGGDGLSISASTLVKRLHEKRLLASTDQMRKSLLVRRVIENHRRSVVHVARAAVYPSTDLPNLPTNVEVDAQAPDMLGNFADEGPPLAHGLAHEPAHGEFEKGNSMGKLVTQDPRLAHDNAQANCEMQADGQIGQVGAGEDASEDNREGDPASSLRWVTQELEFGEAAASPRGWEHD